MAREVEDKRVTDGLSSQAAAVPAGKDGYIVLCGDLNCRRNLIRIARDGNANGHHLVYAGVCAVENARHVVEPDVLNGALEVGDKFFASLLGWVVGHVVLVGRALLQ
jgi:hypothetical protein